MSEHVYKAVELVGSSTSSIEDAIQTAIKRADQTLRNLRWFEVVQAAGTRRTARSSTIRWCSRRASRCRANPHSEERPANPFGPEGAMVLT